MRNRDIVVAVNPTSRVETDPPLVRRLRPDAPLPLEAVLYRALRRRPEQRYASMAAMAQDLAHLDQVVVPDYVVEMTRDGKTVWEWRSWEHLDPETDGHTAPGDVRNDWTGGNAVIEAPNGDILVSMRQNSTVVRFDRQTGDVVWKLGAPPLSGQHAPTPLPNGNILLLDNGPFRPDQSVVGGTPFPFSRAIEMDPDTNSIVWQFREGVPQYFFSPGQGNAQRLPNGNTLVNEGFFGRVFEAIPEGDVVWEYQNPYFGPDTAPAKAQQSQVFRAYRYTAEEIASAQRAV